MIDRRKFLFSAAGIGLAAGFGLAITRPGLRIFAARKLRYLTVTPGNYWGLTQDLGALGAERELQLPGWKPPETGQIHSVLTIINDDGGGLRRVRIPSKLHSVSVSAENSLIYLSGWSTSPLAALDLETLEPQAVALPDTGTQFSGHTVTLPGSHFVATGIVQLTKGKFDAVSIRDARSLKEVARFSSHGFSLHEIRLTPDGKYLVCGHYGSYAGNGPYHDLMVEGFRASETIPRVKTTFPASVTLIDVKSGALFRNLSDREPGPEAHVDSDDTYNVYLGNERPALITRPDVAQNPRFREGPQPESPDDEFSIKHYPVLGPTPRYDSLHREVLVPVHRVPLEIRITSVATGVQRTLLLSPQVAPGSSSGEPPHLNSLEFLPDGRHYVMSSQIGFLFFERGTHRFVRERSVFLPLLMHVHMAIV